MKILICDDDPLFVDFFKSKLDQIAPKLVKKYSIQCISNPLDIAQIEFKEIDIAFLDIDMGALNGISLAHKIRSVCSGTILIFVTNYIEYSLEGYEVQAFRYLLKSEINKKLCLYFSQAVKAYEKERTYLRFCSENNEIDVLPSNLVYIETEQRHLKLHLINDSRDTFLINMTMQNLQDLLQDKGFLRIHQSYIVNMAYIQKIQSVGVWLNGGVKLPISARNYNKIKKLYLEWKGKKRWNI